MRARSIRRVLLVAALGVPLLALLILWLERRPIARDAIDRELARRHVRARYVVAAIGPQTQRLENIVIGDPARPDLVADSATVVLGWGLTGPSVRTIAASGVRLRGRITPAGTLSLGEVDKMLPAPSGAPFALPDIDLAVSDARVRLETPAGPIAMTLQGTGNLQDGFSGHVGAVASQLAAHGCRIVQPTLFATIGVQDREPMIDGPLRAASLTCPGSRLGVDALWVALKLRLGPQLDRWNGSAGVALGSVASGDDRLAAVRGTLAFNGTTRHSEGDVAIVTGATTVRGASVRTVRVAGRAEIDAGGSYGFRGKAALAGIAAPPDQIRAIRGIATRLASTPLGPILSAWTGAIDRAAADADVETDLALSSGPAGGRLQIDTLRATSKSGATVTLTSDSGLRYGWGTSTSADPFTAALDVAGGGLPTIRANLARAAIGAPIAGRVALAPYAVGGARIAATPLTVTIANEAARIRGTVTLDGPLANGRVAALMLPLDLQANAAGALLLNPACAPIGFAALEISGARFGRSSLPLCPAGRALFARTVDGRTGGGGRLAAPRLTGTVGRSPLTITARSVGFDGGHGTITADTLAVTLGDTATPTLLTIANLTGGATGTGFGGRFAGTSGRIGAVPLQLSDAQGRWLLAGGRLTLDGGLQVADTAPSPRFRPLVSRDMTLALDGGKIRAGAWLLEPKSGRRVTHVSLAHDLSSGIGRATLDVPGLVFDDGMQPEALTPLTLGVIAAVKGTIAGAGNIAWTGNGVTSDGSFATQDLALAAAFGPVSGIKGTIRFSDLLGLATPPHQEAVLGQVNPGIAVFGGRVRYQLLPGQRVQVESGDWPLAGGRLVLKPTLLDFGRPTTRRFDFAVEGLDAGKFIEQFKLDNINATGTFDGVLPMQFDDKGGRIVGGRLVARSPGGRLSYVGDVSNAQLGTYGTLAFDALKSIRYQALQLDLDGALDGEVVSRISFTGTNDKPAGVAPTKGIAKSFTNLPFKFNIVVRAPFRGLLNSAAAFADPGALLKGESVQPQESGAVPVKP